MPAYSVNFYNLQLFPLYFVFPDADPRCCLPKRAGLFGGAPTVRFYYNKSPKVKQCKPFIFNGYIGNANNFESLEQCWKTCDGARCP